MKVAYVGVKGLPATAGGDRVVEAIATRMPSLGINPTVYCDPEYSQKDIKIPGIEIIYIPSIPGKYLRSSSQLFFSALHAVFFRRFDLIHLHHIESSFILPILRLHYKVVSTSHGFAYWREKWGYLARRILRLLDILFMKMSNAVTVVSARDADELASRFGTQPVYIPNGVESNYELDYDQASAILINHGLHPQKFFIFVAGRIEPTKGAHIAIESVNNLLHDTHLLIVGDDKQIPQYRQHLHEISGPKIHFQSFVEDRETLYGLMASSLCLVFPSQVEAMSIVLLETASLGVPIVCSDIAENRIVMGDDALYFELDNPGSLREQLHWILEHPEKVVNMSQQARVRIQTEYSWDTIAARYARLYDQTCWKKGKNQIFDEYSSSEELLDE